MKRAMAINKKTGEGISAMPSPQLEDKAAENRSFQRLCGIMEEENRGKCSEC
jgi:hypothetical protein